MAVHDLSRHCESKPRAFAIRLRGEKWLQRSVDVFGGNARALIGHAEKQHFCIGGERHWTDAPGGDASQAFSSRLIRACSSSLGSPVIVGMSAGRFVPMDTRDCANRCATMTMEASTRVRDRSLGLLACHHERVPANPDDLSDALALLDNCLSRTLLRSSPANFAASCSARKEITPRGSRFRVPRPSQEFQAWPPCSLPGDVHRPAGAYAPAGPDFEA